METLGDTGCSQSCLSEAFLRKNVKLYKRHFRPLTSSARSIDGSKVVTVGLINLNFRLGRQYRNITCRVVRNLIHDFVLGWDFFYKYDAHLFAREGYLQCQDEKISLIENSGCLGGAQYAALEEVIIPPRSKAHFPAVVLVDPSELSQATNLVRLEPFDPGDSEVCTARLISRVENGKFTVEAINPFEHAIKIPEGTTLGFAEFITNEELEGSSEYAGMDIDYHPEDSGYESMGETADESDWEESTLRGCYSSSNWDKEDVRVKEDTITMSAAEDGGTPTGDSFTAPYTDPGERQQYAWSVDYTKMAPEAKEHEEAIHHLFEVKHAKVMAKHERDYGCTNLTEHHARLIGKTPIATCQFCQSPDNQKLIGKQVYEMLADGPLPTQQGTHLTHTIAIGNTGKSKYNLRGWLKKHLQVITFQQQPLTSDGTGHSSAYRAVTRPLAQGSNFHASGSGMIRTDSTRDSARKMRAWQMSVSTIYKTSVFEN